MSKKSRKIVNHYYGSLEETMQKKDAELKALASKNAKHFAQKNLPAPKGDSLLPYIGPIKMGYEGLAAHVNQFLQPQTHGPEARIDADSANEKTKGIDDEIQTREEKNRNDNYELDNHHAKTVGNRIFLALLCTGIILIGEIIFNTKAFEIAGESLLFALLLAIPTSFAVFILSHVAPMLYKEAKTAIRRRIILASTLGLATAVFFVMGVFRSRYLEQHEVSISPVYFVIINLFFFCVSALLSYYLLPTWEEIKESLHHIKLHRAINRRKNEIARLKNQKESLKASIVEKVKDVVFVHNYAAYCIERIRKMYGEAGGTFQTVNLSFRSDRQMPDCFHKPLPPAEMNNQINIPPSPPIPTIPENNGDNNEKP